MYYYYCGCSSRSRSLFAWVDFFFPPPHWDIKLAIQICSGLKHGLQQYTIQCQQCFSPTSIIKASFSPEYCVMWLEHTLHCLTCSWCWKTLPFQNFQLTEKASKHASISCYRSLKIDYKSRVTTANASDKKKYVCCLFHPVNISVPTQVKIQLYLSKK